jgi:hypothetical protein
MKSYDRSHSRQRSNLLRRVHNELNLGEVSILSRRPFSILGANFGVTGLSNSWLVASEPWPKVAGRERRCYAPKPAMDLPPISWVNGCPPDARPGPAFAHP